MLKSGGYFSGVQCPSERDEDGCWRPYCPFRHNTSTKRACSSNDAKIATSATQSIDNAIEKIKLDLANSCNQVAPSESLRFEDDYNPILSSSYDPAPYEPSELNKKSTKSVLHAARGASKAERPKKATKNIYKSNSHTRPITDMEYDPVINYSTSVKEKGNLSKCSSQDQLKRTHSSREFTGVPQKKSKLDGQDDDISNMQNPFSSSEEDAEDGFVIDETDDGMAEMLEMESGLEERAVNNKGVSPTKKIKKGSDTSLNAVIEIFSDDDENTSSSKQKQEAAVIDLTSETKSGNGIEKSKNKLMKKKVVGRKKGQTKLHDGKTELKLKDKTTQALEDATKLQKRGKSSSEKKSAQKSKIKKKVSDTKSLKKEKNGVVTAKDIDISQITTFVDREEIKKLEKDLESRDRFQECLQIYQEGLEKTTDSSSSSECEQKPVPLHENSSELKEETQVVGKKRVAHAKASTQAISLQKPMPTRKRISTPAQMMMKRLEIVEEEKVKSIISGKSSTGRQAHPMSAKMAALAQSKTADRLNVRKLEKKVQENPWYPEKNNEPTVCGTAIKGVDRVAHESKEKFFSENGSLVPPKPRIAVERHSKVPTNIRQRYLTTFIDECLRIFNNDHERAYEMAVTEEEQCKKRSNTKNVYLSLAASALKKLRGKPTCEVDRSQSKSERKQNKPNKVIKVSMDSSSSIGKSRRPMSHGKLLDTNTKRCKGGYTIEKKEEKSAASSSELYEKMCRYIMTPEQLDQNGYPRPADTPGKAEFRNDPPPKPFNSTDKKICAHCGKEFILDKKGRFAREEECTYHWGRAYMTRVGKGWEKRYSCCQEREGVEGCTIGDTHVHADNKLDRRRYVRTLSKSPPPDGNCGIYTLDCEMSYTVNGLELTRVSVLDHTCKLVYDTFVKPSGRVLDYNTRWSGITEDDMKNVKTTIRDVQAVFLTKFSADTILMGHSLESDLIALRIIHETVIDTSIVFPHKRGPPYKRSLKNIASENLGLIIQTGASEGHDSAEDAAACMKLMIWKLDEDSKLFHK